MNLSTGVINGKKKKKETLITKFSFEGIKVYIYPLSTSTSNIAIYQQKRNYNSNLFKLILRYFKVQHIIKWKFQIKILV